MRFKDPQGQLARCIQELSQYDMEVQYRAGSKHANADALSRPPEEPICPDFRLGVELTDLPCGGCPHCEKANKNWADFVRDVDDVIPLTKRTDTADVLTVQSEVPVRVSRIRLGFSEGTATVTTEIGDRKTVRVFEDIGGISFGEYTPEQLEQEQEQDPDFKFLLDWLKHGEEPKEGLLFLSSQNAKFYWVNRGDFVLGPQGVLYREKDGDLPRRLVVPLSHRGEILRLFHDIPAAGHQGILRTNEKKRENYFWRGLSSDVERYIAGCCTEKT